MNVELTIDGDVQLIDRLNLFSDLVHQALVAKMQQVVVNLTEQVKDNKLSGQILNVISGMLRDSIYNTVTETSDQVIGTVGSQGVPYAAIHEYGGTTGPHSIVATRAQMLHFIWHGEEVFTKSVNHPGSRMPERSYLRSSLADARQQILNDFGAVVEDEARKI